MRSNSTIAKPAGASDEFTLLGHKWFTSAPMCDAFLTLAYAEGDSSLSCFVVPRWWGERKNEGLQFQRLKKKLGDRSNASSEVEYRHARGVLLGERGRGVPTIIEMVALTRLDCCLGSAGLQRLATLQALNHCSQREAFGKPLVEQPLMRGVLADLALESEASVALAMRLASAFDAHYVSGDADEAQFGRLAVAIGKYFITKRTPALVAEALECHGGNGYVEASLMPRLYRQAPLNSIWEGSGNVMVLDIWRGMASGGADALFAELESTRVARSVRR